jgi:hypothetical protein
MALHKFPRRTFSPAVAPILINWRRGLFRIWLLASAGWVMGWTIYLIMVERRLSRRSLRDARTVSAPGETQPLSHQGKATYRFARRLGSPPVYLFQPEVIRTGRQFRTCGMMTAGKHKGLGRWSTWARHLRGASS